MKTKKTVKSSTQDLARHLRFKQADGVYMRGILTTIKLAIGLAAASALTPFSTAWACSGPSCGGGSERDKVTMDSYIRKNSISKNSPEVVNCALPAIQALKKQLPDLAEQLELHLKQKRYVFVDASKIEALSAVHPNLKHEMANKLIAVNESDSPFVWVNRDFYNSEEMEPETERCSLVLHEAVVSLVMNQDNKQGTQSLRNQHDKDKIIELVNLLIDLKNGEVSYTDEQLAETVHKLLSFFVGLTNAEKLRQQIEVFTYLSSMNQLCDRHGPIIIDPQVSEYAPDGIFTDLEPFLFRIRQLGNAISVTYGAAHARNWAMFQVLGDLASEVGINEKSRSKSNNYKSVGNLDRFYSPDLNTPEKFRPAEAKVERRRSLAYQYDGVQLSGNLVCGRVRSLTFGPEFILGDRIFKNSTYQIPMGQVIEVNPIGSPE